MQTIFIGSWRIYFAFARIAVLCTAWFCLKYIAPAQLQPESSSGYPFQWLVTNTAHLGSLNQKLERQHAISSFYWEDFFPILAECTWDIQVKNVKQSEKINKKGVGIFFHEPFKILFEVAFLSPSHQYYTRL